MKTRVEGEMLLLFFFFEMRDLYETGGKGLVRYNPGIFEKTKVFFILPPAAAVYSLHTAFVKRW